MASIPDFPSFLHIFSPFRPPSFCFSHLSGAPRLILHDCCPPDQELTLQQPRCAIRGYCLGWVAGEQGNLSTARSLIEEALALFREAGVRERVAWSLRTLGELDNWKGEYTRACALCEESLALFRKLGNKSGIAASLLSLALILFVSQGDPARARSLLEEVLALSKELGDKETIASSLIFSGELALSEGDALVARSLAEEALALFRQLELPWLLLALNLVSRPLLARGPRDAP